MLIGMPQGAAATAVDGNGKDGGGGTNPSTARPAAALPLKLLRPLLLVAVLGTGFLAVLVLLLGGPAYSSMLPRLPAAPDALLPASAGKAPLERWARAPASAWHNMTDEELLWAASWRPSVRRYPYRRTPKVAFMFLTRGPLPLAPLWDRFFAGAGDAGLFSVYVHATPGYRPDFPPASSFYRRLVPSQVAEWAKVSMLDAERRLLANALLDPANERFVLLSESCVPLYGFPAVYSYLTRSRASFVGAFDDPGPHGRGRYRDGLFPEVRREQFRKGAQWFELDRALAVDVVADDRYYPKFREHCRAPCYVDDPSPHGRGRYRGGLAPEVRWEQFRKGAQWFELDRALAVDVVADDRYYPKFREHCRAPCYVDEHYLPTALSIEAPARIANRSVTWVDWSRGGAHPATFGEKDVDEEFLKRLTAAPGKRQGNCTYNGQPAEVCFLFARKFAPSTLRPLLRLAPKLLGYGSESESSPK